MKNLDMMGNPCPIPIINAKKELANADVDGVAVHVDNIVSVQNLEKMANGMKLDFNYTEQDNAHFVVTIVKNENSVIQTSAPAVTQPVQNANPSGATVLITSNQMGAGAEELGKILIKGFVFSLTQVDIPPKAVIFLNSGVNLVVEGSNTLDDLKVLSESGTEIFVCGTCLNYYNLLDKLAVGEVVDMYQISTKLTSASNVLNI